MPTYNCFTSPGKLTPEQKNEIARVLTNVYHEEFGIARYLIQVIFYEIAKDDRYIASKPVRPDLVWIRCDVREGRTIEMKSRLLHRVRQGVAKTANVPEEVVWFYLCDLPPENIMEWGHIMPQFHPELVPHNDDAWFQALSEPFKESLLQLA
jgi:phenylpyruvate tautomerase PptA (4-oxalocrotonate tautomerase family)